MNPSCILGLDFELRLQFGQVPLGKFLVGVCFQLTIDEIYLSLHISNQVTPLLDVSYHIIRQNLPKHGDEVILRKSIAILVFQLYPLTEMDSKVSGFLAFRKVLDL